MPPSTFTRSGARRAGDDYQDLVALELLLDMLEHPDRFAWIEVEADDAGALDDVVAQRADGAHVGRQVKFSTHPDTADDPWTWDVLLKQEPGVRGPKQSLIQKWAGGYEALRSLVAVASAEIHSNRRAAPVLAEAMSPAGFIAWDRIADQQVRATLVSQLGSEAAATAFFGGTRFVLDRPTYDVFEDALRRRFLGLGGDEYGWLSLKDELRSWVRIRSQPAPDGKITVPVLRAAARWHRLRPLPEEFEVPLDYVPPPAEFHEDFRNAVQSGRDGCVVLAARPGLGKSTYLSWLFGQLEEQGVPVVRHHYFLSTKDRSVDRLEHFRVAEALMSAIADRHSAALGDLASQNPDSARLRQWLEACGRHYTGAGQRLVVIVDGLDHVWRAKGSRAELDQLFDHLLPASDGVVIVLGTQPVDDEQLPGKLIQAAPRNVWHWLPSLNYAGVKRWVGHHLVDLGITTSEGSLRDRQVTDLAAAFNERSGGHPLHLVYTLRALFERGLIATPDTIRGLPACAHDDIIAYYRELWTELPESGRQILHLIAATRFSWPRVGLLDCLDQIGAQRPNYAEGLRRVAHLLDDAPMGVRPTHSSLLTFVSELPEHADHADRLRRAALAWLRTAAPTYWRWANEWILAAELGEDDQLRNGPSREWAVDAIARRYAADDIDEILGRSSVLSLRRGHVARFVEVALLRDYANEGAPAREDALETLLRPQLMLGEDSYLRPRLHARLRRLTSAEVATLGIEEARRGDHAAMERCWVELLERQSRVEPADDEYGQADRRKEDNLKALLALAPTADPEGARIVRWALANRGVEHMLSYLKLYCCAARRARLLQPLLDLVAANLDPAQKAIAMREAILLAAEEGAVLPQSMLTSNGELYSLGAVLMAVYALNARREPDMPTVRPPAVDIFWERSVTTLGARVAAAFYDAYFYCLSLTLQGRKDDAAAWVRRVDARHPWVRSALERLDAAAGAAAADLRAGTVSQFGDIYAAVGELAAPEETEEYRGTYDLASGWRRALEEITFDLSSLASERGVRPRIDRADLERIESSPFVSIQSWVMGYAERGRPWLSEEALDWLFAKYDEEGRTVVKEFRERAEAYATLAEIAAMHQRRGEAARYVRAVAEHVVAYIDHKDLLLDELLDTARACQRSGTGEPRRWLVELAPAVASVTDFTDGDETRYIPRELGAALAEVAPDLLPPYYRWLAVHEEYFTAEAVFRHLLRVLDLADPVAQAIAQTATDDESLSVIRERARNGDDGARAALERVAEVLGPHMLDDPPTAPTPANSSSVSGLQDEDGQSEDTAPDPAAFPPGGLREFLARASDPPYYRRDRVRAWLDHWCAAGRAADALADAEELIDTGADLGNADRLYTLVRKLRGRNAAYPWLVRAYREDRNWATYFTSKERAEQRWAIMERDYSERWFEFLRDTLLSPEPTPWDGLYIRVQLPRLVEYLIRLGQPGLAADVTARAVRMARDLVSPAPLEQLEWVDGT